MRAACVVAVAMLVAGCAEKQGALAPKEQGPIEVAAPAATPRVVEAAPAPPVEAPSPVPATAEQPAKVQAPAGMREVFPNVRVDAAARVVEFDGIVPIDAHDPNAPWVFLEVVVCTPDTKEHEALVLTQAKASHVHAALLLIGMEPGSPGRWKFENDQLIPIAPTGPEMRVTITCRGPDGVEREFAPQEMIVNAQNKWRFGAGTLGTWVFAGSQIISRGGKDHYDADGAGTLVGLATFGSETIAWSEMISHEAAVTEPAWIADAKTTPAMGSPVTVRIRPAQ